MGYFSSHEQVMQKIVTEEIGTVESFIHEMVEQAAIDCRRDLLWQRLLIGEICADKRKMPKQDLISRETVSHRNSTVANVSICLIDWVFWVLIVAIV
jgi:hypothetical protein